MNWWFNNFRVGVDISESSRKSLENLTNDIKKYTEELWLNFKAPWRHHMTLGYFKYISNEELIKLLTWLDNLKKEKNNILMIDPNNQYDQTLHKIVWRKSNINESFHFVLTPHNPETIYKKFIQTQKITPHINLWSISHEIPHMQELISKIKISRDGYIKDNRIVVDFNKILMEFKY